MRKISWWFVPGGVKFQFSGDNQVFGPVIDLEIAKEWVAQYYPQYASRWWEEVEKEKS
jgi:hypothetical protein